MEKKKIHCCSDPEPAAGHHRLTPLPETPGHLQASLGQSLVGSLLLSPGSCCTRFCLCLQESISQSCVSSGSSLVDQWQPPPRGFMPYPHPELLSPQLSTADPYPSGSAHTPFCLSLCGVSGSWCAQGLLQPSESLWQEWGLILNAVLPLLLSCCGFPLPLDVGYLLKVSPAP